MATLSPRPKMGHRSISEQAPLFEPSAGSSTLLGSRLRGSKASSGSMLRTGSQLPYSPLLPMPPAPSQGELHFTSQPATPTALPLRFTAPLSTNGSGRQSLGMVRSYSLPVATQAEHEAHQRIFAQNGGAGAGFASLSQTQTHSPASWSTYASTDMAHSTSMTGISPLRNSYRVSPGKTHSSLSQKPKPKHLFVSSKPGSPPRAPRSPLAPICINIATIDLHSSSEEQQLPKAVDHTSPLHTTPLYEESDEEDSIDYFGHSANTTADNMDDEARTPRASSPSQHHTMMEKHAAFPIWPSVLDFIHPDHLV